MSGDWEGLLLVDKPIGPTSHDVVSGVRRVTGQRRIGHAGTLDPGASGLLPLVLGRATRLVRFLPDSPKLYTGTLRLGLVSDTDDAAGKVVRRHHGPLPAPDEVLRAAAGLVGVQEQVTPSVSARKVGGQRLYRLARVGVSVTLPTARVEVRRFELDAEPEADLYRFRAEVSAGTYIRALARDLGERLGCGGRLETLVREAIGPLLLADAVAPDADGSWTAERLRERLVPLELLPLALPATDLVAPADVLRFTRGNPVHPAGDPPAGLQRVVASDGRLLGLAELRDGLLHPKVVIEPPSAAD